MNFKTKGKKRFVWILVLGLMVVCLPTIPKISASVPTLSHFDIAQHWAPVWYQDTDSTDYEADYITNFNFDGNWIGNDNWGSFADCRWSLNAYIYYSFVETETHWFLGYYDFHPRDWDDDPLNPFDQHENDMEGVLLTIEKDDSPNGYGEFRCMLTEAHNHIIPYIDYDDPNNNVESGNVDIEGDVEFELVAEDNIYHPIVYVEAKGHGVYGDKRWEENGFPGGDGVIYKPTGTSEIPNSYPNRGNDRHVGYALTSIDVLWDRRYAPYGSGHTFESYGVFDGDGVLLQNDAASAPWGWEDTSDGESYIGEIFYNPAEIIDHYLNGLYPFSHTYTYNSYAVIRQISMSNIYKSGSYVYGRFRFVADLAGDYRIMFRYKKATTQSGLASASWHTVINERYFRLEQPSIYDNVRCLCTAVNAYYYAEFTVFSKAGSELARKTDLIQVYTPPPPPPSGGGGCVAKGTKILLADGLHTKKIQKIEIGDWVLGYNTSSGETVPVQVTEIIEEEVSSLLQIVYEQGKLKVTPVNQPIYMKNASYIGWLRDPQNLKIGDQIFHVPTQSWVNVLKFKSRSGHFTVYDVVTDPLNVFVGNGILLDRKQQ